MSLRLRLNMLLTAIFALVVAIGAAHVLTNVRTAVAEELRSSVELSSRLLEWVVERAHSDDPKADIRRLLAELRHGGKMRHLSLTILDARQAVPAAAVEAAQLPAHVPAWFVRLVYPETPALERVVEVPGGRERILVRAEPDDEIAEAWQETRAMFGALIVFCIVANGLIYVMLGRFLRALGTVSDGLEGIEHGDFSHRLPLTGLPEMDLIGERFNQMARGMEQARRETGTLARRSLAIQEDERRRLASELHDEMGQSISAVKALAVSIQDRVGAVDGVSHKSATMIATISTDVYARVRQMMTRLRPLMLDELGLVSALRNMVDDWNGHHEHIACAFTTAGAMPLLTGEVSINLYRIAQEALTNIAKHAHATEASVALLATPSASGRGPVIVLEIKDNGVGFEPMLTPRGLGRVGIEERAAAIAAAACYDAAPGRGVRISVTLLLDYDIRP